MPRPSLDGLQIPRLSPGGLAGMRRAGVVCGRVLDELTAHVRADVTTAELDGTIHRLIDKLGAVPATVGYRGYPKASCISVNDEVCHSIPRQRRLQDGDILNIDITVRFAGWHADSSRMYFVGRPAPSAVALCKSTFEAMWRGIRAAGPDVRLGDVGCAIQGFAEARGYAVVRNYCGHGIGRAFHQPPKVLHVGDPGKGVRLEPGMCLTIEPILNAGTAATRTLDDGWTVVTVDGSLSAQFEHTIGITENGVETFTLSPAGIHHPDWNLEV